MNKVWLITTGEPDLQVIGAFSSHDLARDQAHRLDIQYRESWELPTEDIANDPWFHHFIEECPLDPELVKEE